MQKPAAVRGKGVLILEERWVPVTEGGDRWAGRTEAEAATCLSEYPAGGRYPGDGQQWDGVTHVEREVRYVTEWRAAPSPATVGDDELSPGERSLLLALFRGGIGRRIGRRANG